MRYLSTRGQAPALGFDDVLLTGLAPDGGLYVPESWPSFSQDDLTRCAGAPYTEVACAVMTAFIGEEDPTLPPLLEAAYGRFAHPAVAPLIQIGADDFLMELHHGPTLAFKDVAMQVLGPLFADRLAAHGRAMTIVAATSGDTGGAAIEAMAGRPGVGICVLHPAGRISEVQRRFMTTVAADNVLNIAVEGTFDDCQALVKEMFADAAFREAVGLGAVNSINWARIVAQVVYYVTSAMALSRAGAPVSFCVPTGNFGDIFAGYVAKQIGAPIGQLIVATNENDILDRALRTGEYRPSAVVPTQSPSMDIQVSSNFERLLYFASGQDTGLVSRLMEELKAGQGFTIPAPVKDRIAEDFLSFRADETMTSAIMQAAWNEAGALVDPHTAVGLAASAQARTAGVQGPLVTLSTAHAAKFPEAVAKATGQHPALPGRVRDLYQREEIMTVLPHDYGKVSEHIRARFAAT